MDEGEDMKDKRSFDPLGPAIAPLMCLKVPLFQCGSIPGTDTRSGLAAGVKGCGAKVFLPFLYRHFEVTNTIFSSHQLVLNGVLEVTSKKGVCNAHPLFRIYKD